MSKILLAGEIMAEKQYLLDKVPAVKEVGMVNEVNYLTSSKIINAGRILAVGNEVSMFGCVGEDTDGDNAIKDFEKYGIDSSLVYTTSEAPTAQVLVLTNSDGQSGFIVYFSANNYFEPAKLENLAGYDYIYMATSMKLPKLYELIERANKDGVKVFLDVPNQQKELDKTKLKTVEFVVPNRQEAEKLLDVKIETVEDALKAVTKLKSYTDGNAIITLDKDGAVAFAREWTEPKHFTTSKVEVVDETGSGDILRGALLREYLNTHNIETSLVKALQLATEAVKYKGVNNSIEETKKTINDL
jgi:ribokinase